MPILVSSPPVDSIMATKLSNGATVPPTQAEISQVFQTIFTAKTSTDSINASYALTKTLLDSIGYRGLHDYGILSEIKKAATDKKSGLRRERGQTPIRGLFERMSPRQAISEVILL